MIQTLFSIIAISNIISYVNYPSLDLDLSGPYSTLKMNKNILRKPLQRPWSRFTNKHSENLYISTFSTIKASSGEYRQNLL